MGSQTYCEKASENKAAENKAAETIVNKISAAFIDLRTASIYLEDLSFEINPNFPSDQKGDQPEEDAFESPPTFFSVWSKLPVEIRAITNRINNSVQRVDDGLFQRRNFSGDEKEGCDISGGEMDSSAFDQVKDLRQALYGLAQATINLDCYVAKLEDAAIATPDDKADESECFKLVWHSIYDILMHQSDKINGISHTLRSLIYFY